MKSSGKTGGIVSTVLMIVLAVILLPILAINLTLIIKGSMDRDVPPSVFGVAPLAVTSGSMDGGREGSFKEGSLIFVRLLSEEKKNTLQTGDVVTFRSAEAYVTHRIVSLNYDEAGNILSAVTQGDANAVTDGAIPIANIVGICTGSVAGLGSFAMFLQTPAGIVVIVGIPVLLFIAYDVTRILLHNRRVRAEAAAEEQTMREKVQEQDEEIRRLRALVGEPPSAAERPQEEDGSAAARQNDAENKI